MKTIEKNIKKARVDDFSSGFFSVIGNSDAIVQCFASKTCCSLIYN